MEDFYYDRDGKHHYGDVEVKAVNPPKAKKKKMEIIKIIASVTILLLGILALFYGILFNNIPSLQIGGIESGVPFVIGGLLALDLGTLDWWGSCDY